MCLEGLRKHGNDPVLMFWKAFGILMEGIYKKNKLLIKLLQCLQIFDFNMTHAVMSHTTSLLICCNIKLYSLFLIF